MNISSARMMVVNKLDNRTLGFNLDNCLFGADDDPDARAELPRRLAEVKQRVAYHFMDGSSLQLCDDRANPELIISQKTPPDSEGWVEWQFEFVEDGEVFTYKENLNYIFEDEEDLELEYI